MAVIGFDYLALAALAEAQGCPPALFAELFPAAEKAAVAAINAQLRSAHDD